MSSREPEPRAARRALLLPVIVLIVGLAATVALTLVTHTRYERDEQRLLALRVRDAAAVLAASLPTVETPLASTAALADATDGNVARFRRFADPLVHGSPPQFVSVSLWLLAAPQVGPVAVAGATPKLAASRPLAAAVFARAGRTRGLTIVGLLSGPAPRLGYAFVTRGPTAGFVAYAESALPADHRARFLQGFASANLDYAIYLGRRRRAASLLVTNVRRLPLTGRTDVETVPFGDSELTLAMSSRVPLDGTLPRLLPWIIAGVGLALSLAAAYTALRLVARRRAAERLAGTLGATASENRRLYAEQRAIAQTLQRALLPETLPAPPGVQTSARYEAAQEGVEVGGDWFDVIEMGERRLLLVVGDVSGHGLPAAATMAQLRFAIRAYAADEEDPARILAKLSRLVSVKEGGHIATVVCALLEPDAPRITIASAGHLPPLLLSAGGSDFVTVPVGPPIGVGPDASYASQAMAAPSAATLIAYTDRLVELRGESLDSGLERLRAFATGQDADLSDLLDRLVSELPPGAPQDDITIVGVRWTPQTRNQAS